MTDRASVIAEPAREIPVRWEADVVVCGGGPAGTAAAIAAARHGAKTLLLERYGCLGGLATGGLVVVLPHFQCHGRHVIGGIGREMRDALIDTGEAAFRGGSDRSAFDPEAMKWLSVRLCHEAGLKILHHVWVAGAVVEDGKVHAVIVESKAGRLAVRGKLFVDATGDGDVFAATGADFETSNQYIGLPFRLTNVDVAKWEQTREENPGVVADAMRAAMEAGGWEGYFGVNPLPTPDGFMWGNNMLCEVDALDPESLTHVETEGREAIRRSLHVLREKLPGFEKAWLVDTASQVGVRRSRRLIGEYVMTEEDVSQEDSRFEDAIGRGNDFRNERLAYDIPYRSLLPRDVNGLLVAGRCISCTHEALEPIREIHVCWVIGEAAGTAAAMAVQAGCEPRDVPVPELQGRLREAGVAFAE
jgi:ribulose 1,5-bisphosphate synthetase/thiazole synthase